MTQAPVELDLVSVAELGVAALLRLMDEDPTRDGLRDTPQRVVRAMLEYRARAEVDVADLLSVTFVEECDEVVLVGPIEFTSLCEHHLMPFHGTGHIAYIPDGHKVVGLSKIGRLLDHFAGRPQVQERLTRQVADALVEHLDPVGVGVVLTAQHSCMTMRGAKKTSAAMTTSATRGAFRDEPSARAELLALIEMSRRA
jgi:GTP cyclohydrolase I